MAVKEKGTTMIRCVVSSEILVSSCSPEQSKAESKGFKIVYSWTADLTNSGMVSSFFPTDTFDEILAGPETKGSFHIEVNVAEK